MPPPRFFYFSFHKKKSPEPEYLGEAYVFFFHGSNQTPFNRDLILSSISSLLAIVLESLLHCPGSKQGLLRQRCCSEMDEAR
jgi:hypothetical protein